MQLERFKIKIETIKSLMENGFLTKEEALERIDNLNIK